MNTAAMRWLRTPRLRWLALVAAVLFAASAVAVALLPPEKHAAHVSAVFSRTVSVYQGSDVRVLGIPIGRVTRVTPRGTDVRVEMEYDPAYKLPADAKAVVVSPSLVADRYVQLLPVYRGGPALAEGAEIPLVRTATPVEIDRVFQALNQLDVALGPKGANADGALSRALDTAARNLAGNGDQANQTIADASRAAATLAGGREELFGTVRNLQAFVSTLAASDREVRAFNQDLSAVAAQLAGDRQELGAALQNLGVALGEVSSFVAEHRGRLSRDLRELADVAGILVKQRKALEEVLDVAPAALSNLHNAFNPSSGTLDTRDDVQQLQDPGLFLCSLLRSVGERADCKTLQAAFAKLRPPPVQGEPDKTLGGILGGGR